MILIFSKEADRFQVKLLDTIRKEQRIETLEVSEDIESGLKLNKSEIDLMENAGNKVGISPKRFYLLIKNDTIAFDLDKTTTEREKGMLVKEILDDYEMNSGVVNNLQEALDAKMNGYAVFSKSYEDGEFITYLSRFCVEQDEYVLLSCIHQEAMLKQMGYYRYITYMLVLCVLLYMMIVLFVCLFIWANKKETAHIEQLEEDITNKNIMIQQILHRDNEQKRKKATAKIYDDVTGLYQGNFYMMVMNKIKERYNTERSKVIYTVCLKLEGNADNQAEEKMMMRIGAQILKDYEDNLDFTAYLGNHTFSYISIGKSKQEVKREAADILNRMITTATDNNIKVKGTTQIDVLN